MGKRSSWFLILSWNSDGSITGRQEERHPELEPSPPCCWREIQEGEETSQVHITRQEPTRAPCCTHHLRKLNPWSPAPTPSPKQPLSQSNTNAGSSSLRRPQLWTTSSSFARASAAAFNIRYLLSNPMLRPWNCILNYSKQKQR